MADAALIVCVCTGNICRSPLAAALLARAADARLGAGRVLVTSAGTHALPGRPATPETIAEGLRLGVDLRHHRARGLDPGEVLAADLVLTMTAAQRDHLGRMAPALRPRLFTLLELARLVADLTAPDGEVRRRIGELAAAAHQRRHAASADDLDVPDPYGAAAGTYRTVADRIVAAVDAIAEPLFGPVVRRGLDGTGR